MFSKNIYTTSRTVNDVKVSIGFVNYCGEVIGGRTILWQAQERYSSNCVELVEYETEESPAAREARQMKTSFLVDLKSKIKKILSFSTVPNFCSNARY